MSIISRADLDIFLYHPGQPLAMIAKILLDTNFLLIPGQFKVDIFSEIERICTFNFELCVLDVTIEELENIARKQVGRDKAAALLAMKLLKAKRVEVIDSGKYVDEGTAEIKPESSFPKSASFKNFYQIITDFKRNQSSHFHKGADHRIFEKDTITNKISSQDNIIRKRTENNQSI